jgi:hypothetical protein
VRDSATDLPWPDHVDGATPRSRPKRTREGSAGCSEPHGDDGPPRGGRSRPTGFGGPPAPSRAGAARHGMAFTWLGNRHGEARHVDSITPVVETRRSRRKRRERGEATGHRSAHAGDHASRVHAPGGANGKGASAVAIRHGCRRGILRRVERRGTQPPTRRTPCLAPGRNKPGRRDRSKPSKR